MEFVRFEWVKLLLMEKLFEMIWPFLTSLFLLKLNLWFIKDFLFVVATFLIVFLDFFLW